jgi:formylglycine-generating enzyme
MTTPYYSGTAETDLQAIGWYWGNSDKAAHEVGKKRPNAFGLYDMSGNVFQWCRDWYGPYGGDATDPMQTRSNLSDKPRRVLRGGSWLKAAHFCRSAARWRNNQASRNADNGFRVEIEIQDDAAQSAHHAERDEYIAKANRRQPTVVKAGFDLFGVIFAVVIAVIVFQIIKALLGRSMQPPDRRQWPQQPPSQPTIGTRFHIEPAADGFWINTIGYPIGSVIHYRYQVLGAPQQSTAIVETGGRQFIYTGDSPAEIVITQIVPPEGEQPMPGTQSNWPASWPHTGRTTTSTVDYPASTSESTRDDSPISGGSFGEEPASSSPSPASDSSSAPSGGIPSAY